MIYSRSYHERVIHGQPLIRGYSHGSQGGGGKQGAHGVVTILMHFLLQHFFFLHEHFFFLHPDGLQRSITISSHGGGHGLHGLHGLHGNSHGLHGGQGITILGQLLQGSAKLGGYAYDALI